MDNPLVACIMLTKDRPEMAARAARSFREQTYDPVRRILIILDTGAEGSFSLTGSDSENEAHDWRPSVRDKSIGELRNLAVSWCRPGSIIIHWDDDDWSHPNRIAEQVALLQASKKQCVGYREMLFWRECATCSGGRGNILPRCPQCGIEYDPNRPTPVGEAWLYRHPSPKYCLGTSLAYWRETWEQHHFPDLPKNNAGTGEDSAWLQGVDSLGVSSMLADDPPRPIAPRMIASIHGKNTMHYGSALEESTSWMRVNGWDEECARTLAL